MRLLSDPRVQRLGLTVAQAIRESPFKGRDEVRRHIEESLHPHRLEIRKLRDELIPAELRDPDDEGYEWDLTLDPKNIHVMQTVSDEWLLELSDIPQSLSKRRLSSESVFGIPRSDYLDKSL